MSANALVVAVLALSVTRTPKLDVPAAVGVPLSTPALLKDKPVGNVPVLSDQWLWVVDGVGHQLLGTVAAEEYAAYCDVFESVAETFDPEAGGRSRSA